MRMFAVILAAAAVTTLAADKPAPAVQAGSERLLVTATLYLDRDAIKKELGRDLGESFIVVKVELAPRGKEPLAVHWDDFLLRSYKDGQKSGAFAPTQIGGKAEIRVSTRSMGASPNADDQGGPTWGGVPGTGGRPQRLPGNRSLSGGGAPGGSETTATPVSGSDAKQDPLLKVLIEKALPEKETSEPVSGLLYFSIEGKVKPKDLALQYDGPAGKLKLQFH
jgi:hypothetical protein